MSVLGLNGFFVGLTPWGQVLLLSSKGMLEPYLGVFQCLLVLIAISNIASLWFSRTYNRYSRVNGVLRLVVLLSIT